MSLQSLITDNITDLLVKIIEFTQIRQKILMRNINSVDVQGFVPKDLAVEEFCRLLGDCIDEHVRSRRLVLCDTENIKFGANGNFEVRPKIDECGKKLREQNRDAYLEAQVNKLLENSLNQRVAVELLRKKTGNRFAPE